MSSYTSALDSIIENEEFITAEEYLHRLENGQIDTKKARIVAPDFKTGSSGGFMVKLDSPRYNPKNIFGDGIRGAYE